LFYSINRIYKESIANVTGEPDNEQCSSTAKTQYQICTLYRA
jgi:hypothetical protein